MDDGSDDDRKLVFSLIVPDDVRSEVVDRLVNELTAALSDLHIALGGNGLEIESREVTIIEEDEDQESAS